MDCISCKNCVSCDDCNICTVLGTEIPSEFPDGFDECPNFEVAEDENE